MAKLQKRKKGFSDEELSEKDNGNEEAAGEEDGVSGNGGEEADADDGGTETADDDEETMDAEGAEDDGDEDDSGDDSDEDEDDEDEDEDDSNEDEDDDIDDEDEDDDIDDDEDDDDDDDEDDEDDSDDEEELGEEDRRSLRRRRRIRNQIISYSVIVLILAGLVAGGVMAGRKVSGIFQERKQAEELERQQAEAEAQEQEPQDMVIEAPEPAAEEPEEDYLGETVEGYIVAMPLEDKVAGLFVITPEALTGVGTAIQAGDGTKAALEEKPVGGLIYFAQNIKDKEQLTEMLANTKSMSRYPIFLAVDEEGGSVSRVADSGIEVIQVDDMASIGAAGDASMAYEAGLTIGSYLTELGFNVDFAPVADVVTDAEGSAIGDRSFGSDPVPVGDMVSNMVQGIEGTGVSACLKHFPGIGDTTEDTHEGRAETAKTLDDMRSFDFIPFQAGIEAGVDFVMVSHVSAPEVDGSGAPSCLSEKIVSTILRGELGFEGIIITDALNMSAITEYYTSGEAAVMAIEAGADMLLMPENYEEAYGAVLAAVQEGTISEERINESLRRIYRVKCEEKYDFE